MTTDKKVRVLFELTETQWMKNPLIQNIFNGAKGFGVEARKLTETEVVVDESKVTITKKEETT